MNPQHIKRRKCYAVGFDDVQGRPSHFTNRYIPLKNSNDNLNRNDLNRSNNSLESPSVCSLGRRKKGNAKARTEARRDTSEGEEFRSDKSLSRQKYSSLRRRLKAARTQRYLRRVLKL
ncbi:hypothetical protein FQR65_LT09748 [Abscondita terminalis]|nr:hypothetical protein FQR65_LT09748 [Abscondita terminalis]